jgi:hypothetical protein
MGAGRALLEWGFYAAECVFAAALQHDYLPQIMERIAKTAPAGADLTSWKY